MTTLTPVLSAHWDEADSFTIAGYKRHGGYKAAAKALKMEPDAVIQLVKDSGLRGRGGAGFPTGMKWGFIPQGDNKDHYLVVNADESEPGTCKDMPLLMANPHVLVEGVIIAAYAIRAKYAFIYIRGEVAHVARRLQQAIEDAYAAGYLGKNVFKSGTDIELVLHVGAGAYICGEETALLDSLEGFRGQPRLRPPFPAIAGLYARPTVVNNVESIASVPAIVATVLASSGGIALVPLKAIPIMKEELFPLASLITPNLPEAAMLAGLKLPPATQEAIEETAVKLLETGAASVLIKGGHGEGEECRDCLYIDNRFVWFSSKKIVTGNTHGTGCTLSSAIAAFMARGEDTEGAVKRAKEYLDGALQAGARYRLGSGSGPLHHFYRFWQ